MTNYNVDAEKSDKGKTQLEFWYETPSYDAHRILKTVADRSVVGLPIQPTLGVRGLHVSNRITTCPSNAPNLPIKIVSAVSEELCDKLNHLVEKKKKQKTRWLKKGSKSFLNVGLSFWPSFKKSKP